MQRDAFQVSLAGVKNAACRIALRGTPRSPTRHVASANAARCVFVSPLRLIPTPFFGSKNADNH